MKRLITLFLSTLSTFLYADTEVVDGIVWKFYVRNGEAILDYQTISPSTTGAVSIPSELSGYPVTCLSPLTFSGCSGLTSIVIPDSVMSIGWSAFSGCSGLMSVTIPDSVTSIGGSAFYGCSNSLFDTNTISGAILVDGWIVEWSDSHFGDLNLTGIRGIADEAFDNCSWLTSVMVPYGVKHIGGAAFRGCNQLISVGLPDSVKSIGNSAFDGCSELSSITIPNGVTSIGDFAFSDCSELSSITIPDGVTSIGAYAFSGCSSLTAMTIPESVNSIGVSAFSGCSGLRGTLFNPAKTILWFVPKSTNGVFIVPEGIGSIGNSAFSGCSELTTIAMPNSVTNIGSYAFSGCSGLLSITIPEEVSNIGSYAFSDCSELASISIPGNVTRIANDIFSGCSNLTSILLPNGVTMIEYEAFTGCSRLRSITIPTSVRYLDPSSFSGCSGLSSVVFDCNPPDGGKWHVSKWNEDGSHSFVMEYRGLLYDCPGPIQVELTTNVNSIGAGSFANCSGISSITIPGSVTNIGGAAFWGIPNPQTLHFDETSLWLITEDGILYSKDGTVLVGLLHSLGEDWQVPTSVTRINDGCFWGLSDLVSIVLPTALTTIGDFAFQGCSNLSSLELPSGLTSIGECAFDGCSNLTSIELPPRLESIPYRAFADCSKLQSIDIPDGVTSIGNGAFDGCSELQSLYLPEGLAIIGRRAFDRCSQLTQITIPGSVLTLADGLFRDCSTIEEVVLPRHFQQMVPKLEIPESTTVRYVDCSSLTSPIPVSHAWLNHFPTLLDECGGDFETAANAMSANGRNTVWECYLAGIDPTNTAAAFTCSITMTGEEPSLSWSPNLGDARSYKVEGKAKLSDSEWISGPNAAQHFFKVKVLPPMLSSKDEF